MKNRKKIAIALVLAGVTAIFLTPGIRERAGFPEDKGNEPQVGEAFQSARSLSGTEEPPRKREDPVEIDPETDSPAVLETRRMYMAHAPLREQSVDDPDSLANKRIMQRMVTNALSRKQAPGTKPSE